MNRIVAILFISMLLAACVTEDEPRNEGLAVGDPLPLFTVTLNDGTTVSPQSLRGKVVAIVFFNTSCSDCQRELPLIQTVYEQFANNIEVAMLAISREESADNVLAFWERNNMTIPYSAQADRDVYNLFAYAGVPRLYIADKKGIIIASYGDNKFPKPTDISNFIAQAMIPEPFKTIFQASPLKNSNFTIIN